MSRCCFSPDSMAPVNRVLLYRYRNTESRVQVYQNSKTGHELQFKANCFILGVFVNITIKIKNTTLCIIQTFAMWGKMMLPSWRNRLLKISLIFFLVILIGPHVCMSSITIKFLMSIYHLHVWYMYACWHNWMYNNWTFWVL